MSTQELLTRISTFFQLPVLKGCSSGVRAEMDVRSQLLHAKCCTVVLMTSHSIISIG